MTTPNQNKTFPPMKPLSSEIEKFMAQFSEQMAENDRRIAEAELKPQVKCQVCNTENVLDLPDSDKTCAKCEAETRLTKKVEKQARELQNRIDASNLPPRWRDKKFSTFKTSKGNEHAYSTLQASFDGTRGVTLIGQPGTGKTHLLAATTLEWCERGYWPVFVKTADLRAEITAEWKDRASYDVTRIYSDREIVLLDELTFESQPPEFVLTALNKLIDDIYDGMKTKLYLSTNLSVSMLGAMVGARFVSRLSELTEIREVKGNDQRLQYR